MPHWTLPYSPQASLPLARRCTKSKPASEASTFLSSCASCQIPAGTHAACRPIAVKPGSIELGYLRMPQLKFPHQPWHASIPEVRMQSASIRRAGSAEAPQSNTALLGALFGGWYAFNIYFNT